MFRRALKWFRPRSLKSLFFSTVKVACAAHLVSEHVGLLHYVAGPSMLPTMAESGELVLNDRISHILFPSSLRRGDLLVFISPLDPTRTVCKRLLGLPGDVVCVDPMGVYAPSTEHVVVPQGHVWVAGDNVAYSRDSRMYGPLPMGLIRGRLVARVFPWKDRTWFRNPMTLIGEI